jgi:rhodanese-related sulfurtransferase
MNLTNLITFAGQHWILVLLLIAILGALIWLETQAKVGGMARVKPQEAIHLINRDSAVVIDVREKNQYKEGHIAKALHMTKSDLGSKNLSKYQEKPVILVCNTGVAAPKMSDELKKQGITQLYFLQGGMSAWYTEGLPVVKK